MVNRILVHRDAGEKAVGLARRALNESRTARKRNQKHKNQNKWPAIFSTCLVSNKNAVPVAQAPCQHIMTEGTVHRITVLEREKQRQQDVYKRDRQTEIYKRYKEPLERERQRERQE